VRWALVTLSGITRPGVSSNDIWAGIAAVMGRAGANIQDAAGTFAPQPVQAPSGREAVEPIASNSSDFVLGAFGTRIAPYADPYEDEPGVRRSVALFFRAAVPEDNVPLMSSLMQKEFPLLVCTVTMGGALDEGLQRGAMLSGSSRADQIKRDRLATLYFFGADYVGQLARLTSAMLRCRVSIVHLKTSTGNVDPDTCEYVERAGGPLSENVITVSSIDEGVLLSAERLRAEIGPVAEEVGYEVFAVVADEDEERPRILAEYHLHRKSLLQRFAELRRPDIELGGL